MQMAPQRKPSTARRPGHASGGDVEPDDGRRRMLLGGVAIGIVLGSGCAAPERGAPAPAAPAASGPSSWGDPRAPVAGRVLGTVVHTRDAEELRYVALRALSDRFAAEQRIEVSADEVEAYARHVRAALAADLASARARRDELAARVSATPSGAERERLQAELEQARRSVAALEDIGVGAPPDPADAKARAEIAAAFVRQWKIDGALWRRYGGRVGYQQGGPEPLDAHRALLEQARASGDLMIADLALDAAFWRYYTDDARHSFYPRGSPEEARAFATPPWAAEAAR